MSRRAWWTGTLLLLLLAAPAAAAASQSTNASQSITINVPAISFVSVAGGPITFEFDQTHWPGDPEIGGALSDVSEVASGTATVLWLTNASRTSPVKITVGVNEAPPEWVSLFKVELASPSLQAGSGSCGEIPSGGVPLTTSAQPLVTGIHNKVCIAEATYSVAVDLDGYGTYSPTVTWTIGP